MEVRIKSLLFVAILMFTFGIGSICRAATYNFESGYPSGFSGGAVVSTEGYSAYGFGDSFLWSNGSVITLTLTGLSTHTSINLGFYLATIDSWDGDSHWAGPTVAPDYFNVSVDGVSIFMQTFDHIEAVDPAYNAHDAELIVRSTTNLNKNGYNDAAYNMGLASIFANIAHTSANLTISWWADVTGWQGILNEWDESFAIDNVNVVLNGTGNPNAVPEPATMLLLGTGLFGLAGLRRRIKK